MKGVILAGGSGTRLRPLTELINKHLLPVGRYPMIFYSIDKMRNAGITDIMIVTNKQSAGLYVDFLGSGTGYGVSLTYRIQDQAGGIAQALSLANGFVGKDEAFAVILGDNLFEESLSAAVTRFDGQPDGAMVLLKRVDDPRRYGVPAFQDGRIVSIEEKPSEPKSDFCVTGIYFYHASVFDVISHIKPSQRGELEITDVNNFYAKQGTLTYLELGGWWTDAGTFHSLYEASSLLLSEHLPPGTKPT